MILGKIVSSSSHTDYVCRIYAQGEVPDPPPPGDYGFGRFIAIEQSNEGFLVGVVRDTVLQNPDFGSLGPRLAPADEVPNLTPDYVVEQATLVAIIVLGSISVDGSAQQGVPPLAATLNAQVRTLLPTEIKCFHMATGALQLAYLPMLLVLNSPLACPLALCILDHLAALKIGQRKQLVVLADNIRWKSGILPAG